jgi:hypothetical protein
LCIGNGKPANPIIVRNRWSVLWLFVVPSHSFTPLLPIANWPYGIGTRSSPSQALAPSVKSSIMVLEKLTFLRSPSVCDHLAITSTERFQPTYLGLLTAWIW